MSRGHHDDAIEMDFAVFKPILFDVVRLVDLFKMKQICVGAHGHIAGHLVIMLAS